jgi:hypothetical protein
MRQLFLLYLIVPVILLGQNSEFNPGIELEAIC